jgi:N-acetyl-gamma-glutamylphosphate reductase
MVPIVGAVGVTGCALITILADATETHVDALVTV